MTEYRVAINLSAKKMLTYYAGQTRNVIATSDLGIRVQFPANVLQQFVSESGVQGMFVIRVDENNKFHSIDRVGDIT